MIKKILVLGPILAEYSEITAIAKTLKFLEFCYELDFIDPLGDLTQATNSKSFFDGWRHKLNQLVEEYEGFFGFSLGGVILQQCFSILEKANKPAVFFSVPSFCDTLLLERLNKVKELIKTKSIIEAINQKNQFVFYPAPPPLLDQKLSDPEHATLRLLSGLKLILETDSRSILEMTKVNYLHLIGEKSMLVNRNNVIVHHINQLMIVPHSGMRVLKDNLMYCIDPIVKFLGRTLL